MWPQFCHSGIWTSHWVWRGRTTKKMVKHHLHHVKVFTTLGNHLDRLHESLHLMLHMDPGIISRTMKTFEVSHRCHCVAKRWMKRFKKVDEHLCTSPWLLCCFFFSLYSLTIIFLFCSSMNASCRFIFHNGSHTYSPVVITDDESEAAQFADVHRPEEH